MFTNRLRGLEKSLVTRGDLKLSNDHVNPVKTCRSHTFFKLFNLQICLRVNSVQLNLA